MGRSPWPEGEETDKLKVIVAKTGSIIRVMSEVIPHDLRSVMADMEVLEAKEKVVKEKLDPEKKKVIESANEERTTKPNSETADKSGKIKRRGKKKANEKDEEAQNIAIKPDNREVMDTAIIKRMVGQLMKDCEATTLKIDMADIEEIVDKLERGEEVGQPGHREVEEEGGEALRRLEDAVKRKGAAARELHRELIEKGRRMTKGKTRREILEAMLVDEQDERITSCEENSSEDEEIENQGEFKTMTMIEETRSGRQINTCSNKVFTILTSSRAISSSSHQASSLNIQTPGSSRRTWLGTRTGTLQLSSKGNRWSGRHTGQSWQEKNRENSVFLFHFPTTLLSCCDQDRYPKKKFEVSCRKKKKKKKLKPLEKKKKKKKKKS